MIDRKQMTTKPQNADTPEHPRMPELQESVSAMDLPDLKRLVRRLKIPGRSALGAMAEHRNAILEQDPDVLVRELLPTWWQRYHNHFYGTVGIAVGVAGLVWAASSAKTPYGSVSEVDRRELDKIPSSAPLGDSVAITGETLKAARSAFENGQIRDVVNLLEEIDRTVLMRVDSAEDEQFPQLVEYSDIHSATIVTYLPTTKHLQAIDHDKNAPLGVPAQPNWSSQDWLREMDEVVAELALVRKYQPSLSQGLRYRHIYTKARRLALLIRVTNPKEGLSAGTAFRVASDFLTARADLLSAAPRELGSLGFSVPIASRSLPAHWYPWPIRGDGMVKIFSNENSVECAVGLFEDNGAMALYTPVNISLEGDLQLSWEWMVQTSLDSGSYSQGGLFPCQVLAVFDNNTIAHYTWSAGHGKGSVLRASVIAPELEDTPMDVAYDVVKGADAPTQSINGRNLVDTNWFRESIDLNKSAKRLFPDSDPPKKLVAIGIQCLSQRPDAPVVGLFRSMTIAKKRR